VDKGRKDKNDRFDKELPEVALLNSGTDNDYVVSRYD